MLSAMSAPVENDLEPESATNRQLAAVGGALLGSRQAQG
jgi:hypothetical protein